MKKHIMSACGLVAAALVCFASGDTLNFIKNNNVVHTVNVDRIDNISYASQENAGAGKYTHMVITKSDGTTEEIALDGVDEIVWHENNNPLTIVVEPHHTCATLHITSSDPDVYYRLCGRPTELFPESVSPDDRADYLINYDKEFIYSVAEQSGLPLGSFRMDQVFEHGDQARDWFPSVVISDNTPISLVAYTGIIENDKVVVTTDPLFIEFTTKKLEDLGVTFDISYEATSTTLSVQADAVDSDIPFAMELYSEWDVATYGLTELLTNTITQYEQMVYKYGATWDEVTFRNHGEKKYSNRRMGDRWLAVAFGMEYGVVTTDVSFEWITIPAPVVTDPCTFEVTTTQKSASEVMLDIVPSSDDVRYVAFLESADKLNGISGVQHVANRVYWLNYTRQVIWSDTEYMHTGRSTLSSHDDVIDGVYLELGKDYKLFIVGLADDGTQVTAVKEVDVCTEANEVAEFTFDIDFINFENDNNWTHFITYQITPSDPDARYVAVWMNATNSYADLSYSDEEFISRYVGVQGQYLELYNGYKETRQSMGSTWSSSANAYVFGDYILAVFGYDGRATTPLYAYRVNSATGEVEQVRGPGI